MSNPIKVVLISQVSLPFPHIGSWTTLYKNYLQNNHKIDMIVCSKPKKIFDGIKYSFVKFTFLHKLRRKFLKKKNTEYFQALDKVINLNERYIFQVIDNYGMVKPLKDYLISKKIEKQSYIQFFYHGFPPHIQKDSGPNFYEIIDELILLTYDSYKEHQKQIPVLPRYVSVLYNGIDTQIFTKVSITEKIKLKEKLGYGDKTVFIWCSQDKPKKGLSLILDVWKEIYSHEKNIVLVVIGCDSREEIDGVKYLGKIPNNELPKYYQSSDCYLFPSLYKEGFPLSLTEALRCGNYCIASALGGVVEVMQYGKFGKLIEDPHLVSDWVNAINDFLEGKFVLPEISRDLYSMENWNDGMNIIIENAKIKFNSKVIK